MNYRAINRHLSKTWLDIDFVEPLLLSQIKWQRGLRHNSQNKVMQILVSNSIAFTFVGAQGMESVFNVHLKELNLLLDGESSR